MVFGGDDNGLPAYPLTPVYRCHKVVDSFSQNQFFGELRTDFSDCRKGSKLPFFSVLKKRVHSRIGQYVRPSVRPLTR